MDKAEYYFLKTARVLVGLVGYLFLLGTAISTHALEVVDSVINKLDARLEHLK